jgi:tellurite resistance protein TerC
MESIGTPALWIGFSVFVVAMLTLDLGVFHRKAHEVKLREAVIWSAVWIGLALAFNVALYVWFGPVRALEFLTGYVLEKALSVDNIFVMLVLFASFKVPAMYVHRVLFWGILGALIMRAIFIVVGAALLSRFHWIMYIFGALLIVTGVKLLFQKEEGGNPQESRLVTFARRILPLTPDYRGPHFTVIEGGKRYGTPLLLVLLAVETTDLIFAVDSIPAIFAVTMDPFIVYTSNIFAILGLRSLFFLLAGVMDKFHYLKIGLAFVLTFVGAKMLLVDVYKIPIGISLGVIAGMLGLAIGASLLRPRAPGHAPGPAAPSPPLPKEEGG